MHIVSRKTKALVLFAMLAVPASGSVSAQSQEAPDPIIVEGSPSPSPEATVTTKGPEIKGIRDVKRVRIGTGQPIIHHPLYYINITAKGRGKMSGLNSAGFAKLCHRYINILGLRAVGWQKVAFSKQCTGLRN